MKFALYNPKSPFLIDSKVFPPLGLLYLSAALKKAGHDVEVVDMVDRMKVINDADVHGVTCTTPQWPDAKEIISEIRKADPEAYVVVGGPHASLDPASCVESGVNLVISGEGEEAITNINRNLGCYVWKTATIEDIDKIPHPDRSAVNIHEYKYSINNEPATSMITSRGCPYKCAFCSENKLWNGRVRMNSASYVIEELHEIQNNYEINAVMFYDDIFILDKKRLVKICQYLRENKIVWRAFVRANLISNNVYKLMAKSGCKEVLIGIESGSQTILNNIHKKTTVRQNEESVLLAKKNGIRAKALIIVGNPGETDVTLMETASFLERTEPDDVDFTILQIYPGSSIFDHPERYDLTWKYTHDFFKGRPGEYKSNVCTSGLTSEDILRWRIRLEERFKKWQ